MFACRDGKGAELSSQASKMLFKVAQNSFQHLDLDGL